MSEVEVVTRDVNTDDGVRLYARMTRGRGARLAPIVCANGIGVSTFFWKLIERDFARERPVIVWDYRGHGKSARPSDLSELTMRRNAQDLVAVLDAYGVERAVLAGHSMGVQVILETYRIAAARVAGLVAMQGTYGRPVDTFFASPIAAPLAFMATHRFATLFPRGLAAMTRAVSKKPVVASLVKRLARLTKLVDPERMPKEALDEYIDHMGDFDPEVFYRMAEKMAVHTTKDLLPRVEAPVLVVAGEKDLFTPLWLSEEMADAVPRGRLLIVANGSHTALVEQPEVIHPRLAEFLRADVDA